MHGERRNILILPKSTQKFMNTSNTFKKSLNDFHENVSHNHKPYTVQVQDFKATTIYPLKPNNLVNRIQQTDLSTQNGNEYLPEMNPQRHEEDSQQEDSFVASQQDYEINELINSTQTDPDFVAVSSIIQTEVIKDRLNNVDDDMKKKVVIPTPKLLKTHMNMRQQDKEPNVRPVEAKGILEDAERRDKRNKDMALSSVEENEIGKILTHAISKRNVIEEENLASTVSAFKFTGAPESRLSNKLFFNNINE